MSKKLFAIRKELRPAQIVTIDDAMIDSYHDAQPENEISCCSANGEELILRKKELLEDTEEIKAYLVKEETRRSNKVKEMRLNQPSALKRLITKILSGSEPNNVETTCDHWYSWRDTMPVYRMFLPCYQDEKQEYFFVYRTQQDTIRIGQAEQSEYSHIAKMNDLDQNINALMDWIIADLSE